MDTTIAPYIREAAASALRDGNDAAALKMLQMIAPKPASLPPAKAEPADPYHPTDHWVAVIEEVFIPYLKSLEVSQFTTHQLLTWVESNCSDTFWKGDLNKYERGTTYWRSRVSTALGKMVRAGKLIRTSHTTYMIP